MIQVVGKIGASIFSGQPITAVQAVLLTSDHVDGLGDVVTMLIGSSLLTLLIT